MNVERGTTTFVDCEVLDCAELVTVSEHGNATIRNCRIGRCESLGTSGATVVHGGHLEVIDSEFVGNWRAIWILGRNVGQLRMEGTSIAGGVFGIWINSDAVVDLGGGPLGSSGRNSFNGVEESIIDLRPAYSGPLYAMHNIWESPATGSLEGPMTGYNPARCYIENEGNSIIFSD